MVFLGCDFDCGFNYGFDSDNDCGSEFSCDSQIPVLPLGENGRKQSPIHHHPGHTLVLGAEADGNSGIRDGSLLLDSVAC